MHAFVPGDRVRHVSGRRGVVVEAKALTGRTVAVRFDGDSAHVTSFCVPANLGPEAEAPAVGYDPREPEAVPMVAPRPEEGTPP